MLTDKQKFLTVWRDGEEWYDFPESNEQNVMDALMKKNLSQRCVILPKGEAPHKMKTIEIKAPAQVAIPVSTPKTITATKPNTKKK